MADVIVAGLGAVGSAAAYHLAHRGCAVLGLDRFAPPHPHGSSHGGSRIIRKAYFEGARYVPLLQRAYVCWEALEAETGAALLHRTGGLFMGPEGSDVVRGARRSAEVHGLNHAWLSGAEVRARFPAFALPDDHVALWEADAGWLDPEACIEAHLSGARRRGADLRTDEPVLSWTADGDGVAVHTAQRTYRAGRLVVCAGGWLHDLLPGLHLGICVERQVNAWFRPAYRPEHFTPDRCPVFIWTPASGRVFYGFPDLGAGVKAGVHHEGERVAHPDALRRAATSEDEAAIREVLRRLLPAADGACLRRATCFYTNTPDQHYLIDRHPDHPQVLLASACSGHGFKASSAVGEALADLAEDHPPSVDLSAFHLRKDGTPLG